MILKLPRFLVILLLAVILLLGLNNSVNAQGNGFFGAGGPSAGASAGGQTNPWTGSIVDNQNYYYDTTAPHMGDEVKAEKLKKQDASDEPEKYKDLRQPGMQAGDTQPAEAENPKDQTVAEKHEPTPPPAKPHHNEMTEYERPGVGGYGVWGPPKKPQYQHHPQDNTSLGAPANPAMMKGWPKWMTDGSCNTSNCVHLAMLANAAHQGAMEQNSPSLHTSKAQFHGQMQHAGGAANSSAEAQFGSNVGTVQTNLINVANEGAGTPTSSSAPKKTLSQAVWMVQQMYKGVFIPMAILFLLPGAVATQAMAMVKYGVNRTNDEDTVNPFTGILRGTVALFLIPATQLIISYSIDVGNSLTYEVTQFIQAETITQWADGLYNPNGKQSEKQRQDSEGKETGMQAMMRFGFGSISTLLNYGLMVLCAYQVVIVCYLMLMAPIAACFLAWPMGIGQLFRPVFSNWLEALLNLVLWRFWWCIILLCMCTRINWLMEMGQFDPKSPWEPIVFIAFSVMLTYIPFMALDFKPGDMVDQLLEKTKAGLPGGKGGSKPGPVRPGQHSKAA